VRDYAACAARGLTKAETARELGVSFTSVSRAAERLGVDFRAGQRPSRRDEYAACADLTMRETARKMGVTVGAVLSAAKRHGLTFRSGIKSRRHEYEACAAQGMTQIETSRAIGVTRQSVCMAVTRYGIKFRPHPKIGRAYGILSTLTPAQRDDYRTLMRHQYSRAAALAAIGRADLLDAPTRMEAAE
jgi:hypothetical protein